ncbi:MAG: LysM peptidoglycan-binding domain-containing protein [Ahniella sp.]|nr:LysM peptidoglycan-binding domain-containing protein [Ahniella sp.]
MYSIAFRHGLDYREVARWNQLSDPSRILVGQVLRLSPPASAPAPIPVKRPPVVVNRPVSPPPTPAQQTSTSRTPTSVSNAIGLQPKPTPVAPAPQQPSAGSSGQPQTVPLLDEPALAPPQVLVRLDRSSRRRLHPTIR